MNKVKRFFVGLVLAMCAWSVMAINGAGGGLETLIQKAQGDGRGGGDVVIKVTRESSSGYRIDFSGGLAAVRTAAEGNNLGPQAQTLQSTQGGVYVLTNPADLEGATVQLFCLPAANQSLTTPGTAVAQGKVSNGKVSIMFNGDCHNSMLSDMNKELYTMNAIVTLSTGDTAWFGIADCAKLATLGPFQSCSTSEAPVIAFHADGRGLSVDEKGLIAEVFK